MTIAAALFLVWWIAIRPGDPASPGIDDRKVVILPFQVRGSEELLPWREEMVNAIHFAVQGSEEVRSFDPNRISNQLKGDFSASEDPDVAAQIAERNGAGWFVLGTISKVDQVVSVTTRLYKVGGEPVELRRLELTGEPRLQAIADTLAQGIVGSILKRPNLVLPSLASQTTDSPEAFKLYLIGTARLREGKNLDAEEALERALEFDSTFALAAFMLSQTNISFPRSIEDGLKPLRQAARHAGRVKTAFRYLIDAEVAAKIEGDADTAEQHYLNFLKVYPDDGFGLQRYGDFLFHYNPPRGRSADESRPYLEAGFNTAGDLSHMMGHLYQFAKYDRDVERMTELHRIEDSLAGRPPDELEQTFRRMELVEAKERGPFIDSLARANYYRNIRLILTLVEDIHGAYRATKFMDEPVRSNLRLRLESARGRFRMLDSLRLYPGMETFGTNLFRRVNSATLPFSPLYDDQLIRIRDEVISWDTTEVARFSFTHEHRQGALKTYLLGLLAFRMEDDDTLAGLVNDAAENEAGSGQDLSNLVTTTLRALQAVRADDMDTALQLFDSAAVPFPVFWDSWGSPLYSQLYGRYIKAELLYEAGRLEEALPIYLSFLSGFDVGGLYVIGPAYLRRAQIYEALGDEKKAIDFYERFIDLWRDADPELQKYVVEAREQLDAILKRPIAEPQS
ncbi:MAG: hypothetical protein IH951_12100 [Bacteroidetes bacterium]|nr:hypothetical protein [Bacteroidota bacterium]